MDHSSPVSSSRFEEEPETHLSIRSQVPLLACEARPAQVSHNTVCTCAGAAPSEEEQGRVWRCFEGIPQDHRLQSPPTRAENP